MVAPKTDVDLREKLIGRELTSFSVSSPLESDTSYLLSRLFETELLLQERLGAIFDKIYLQPDYEFLRLFKEIDRGASGLIHHHNMQVFLNNAGVNSPQLHELVFRRCSPRVPQLDINDFRRIFDVYGKGILGNSARTGLLGDQANRYANFYVDKDQMILPALK